MSDLIECIKARLAVLNPAMLELQDDSAAHRGHAGNTGGAHFTLRIQSAAFNDISMIMRHRKIYALLADLIPAQIHALSIEAKST